MALVAVAITLGTPNEVGQVPVTVSNLATAIADAVADTTALAADIVTAAADAASADTDVAAAQTANATAATAGNVANSATNAVSVGLTTADTDFDTFAAAVIAITGDTYNATTDQFTFGGATGLTHAQWATVGALLNTAMASYVTAKTNAATAHTNTDTVATDIALVTTALATAKAQTLLAKTEVAALSTSDIAADHTASQALISSANVFIQTDTSVATSIALFNGALVSALTFVRDETILPT